MSTTLSHSYLFVPASRPDRFDKAAAAGAGQVILDLEDAVVPQDKDAARQHVAAWSRRSGATVRINGADTTYFAGDVAMVRDSGMSRVILPKAEPATLEALSVGLGKKVALIALIETVAGFMSLRNLAVTGLVSQFAFGNLDFGIDSGITEVAGELDPVRLQIVLESRLAGLPAPIDGVSTSWADEAMIRAEAGRSKALGFGAKLCIHPAQVKVVNEIFRPSEQEVAWASRVMEVSAGGAIGAVALNGKMIDAPVVRRARAILENATNYA